MPLSAASTSTHEFTSKRFISGSEARESACLIWWIPAAASSSSSPGSPPSAAAGAAAALLFLRFADSLEPLPSASTSDLRFFDLRPVAVSPGAPPAAAICSALSCACSRFWLRWCVRSPATLSRTRL